MFMYAGPPSNDAFYQLEGKAMSNRDVYIAKMKLQLDELNGQMSILEAKAKEAREDARARYQEEMAKLRDQSKLAQGKLDTMKSATEEAWDATVAEMEKVRDAFVHSFSYFKSQI